MSNQNPTETQAPKRKNPNTPLRRFFRTLFLWLPLLYLLFIAIAWFSNPNPDEKSWFFATPHPNSTPMSSSFEVQEQTVQPISYIKDGAQWDIYGNANQIRDVAYYNGRLYRATANGITVFDVNDSKLLHHITLADGLPSHNVTAVAVCQWESPILIASTMQGVVAIDISFTPPLISAHWTVENSGMSDNLIVQGSLACSPPGSEPAVYIGHPQTVSIYHPRTGSWSHIEASDTEQILATADTLWLRKPRDIIQYDLIASANKFLYARGEDNFPYYGALHLALTSNKTVWAIGENGLTYGIAQPNGYYDFTSVPPFADRVRDATLLITKNDDIWLALSDGTVCRYDRDQENCDKDRSYTLSSTMFLLELENGAIGINQGSDFYKIDQASGELIKNDLSLPYQATSNTTNAITQSENQIIIGGMGEFSHITLNEQGGTWARSVFHDERLEVNDLQSDSEKGLWVATNRGILYQSNTGEMLNYPLKQRIGNTISEIHHLTIDSNGTVWIGAKRTGLWHWKRNSFRAVSLGQYNRPVRDLITHHNDVWIVSEHGDLIRHTPDNNQTDWYRDADLFTNERAYEEPIKHLVSAGNKLYVTDIRTLWQYAPQEDTFTKTGLEVLHPLTALAYDENSETLYIGTEQEGIFALQNNQFQHIIQPDELPQTTVQALFVDTAGDLWISTVQYWPPRGSSYFRPQPQSASIIRYSPPAP